MLNFWATWCPPCRMEIPGFMDLQAAYGEDVVFVGVALDEDGASSVRPYTEAKAITYPVLPEGRRAGHAYGGIDRLPTTFLIDRRGEIRYRHAGLLLPGNLKHALDALRRGS